MARRINRNRQSAGLQTLNQWSVTRKRTRGIGPLAHGLVESLESRRLLSITFTQLADYPVLNRPTWAVDEDFNGDGNADVAVSINDSHKVTVMFGNGDGTFSPRVDYATAGSTSLVTAADFNGDGSPDMAVSLHSTNWIQVFRNNDNGTGTFAAPVTYVVGNDPLALASADLDGDGWFDLLVTNNASNTLSVLMNNQDGTFAPQVQYPTGNGPLGVTVADLDEDSKLDVVVANNFSNTLSIFLGNGDGTLVTQPDVVVSSVYSRPFWVTAGDLDGDGSPDLVVTNYVRAVPAGSQPAGITVLVNDGAGSFGTKTDYESGNAPVGVALGDFDNDGGDDVAVANSLTPSISIFAGNGDGTLSPKFDLPAGDPAYPLVSDVDNDGRLDLVVANNGANNMRVFLNSTEIISPPAGVLAGAVWLDLNNDGQVDFGEAGIEGVQVRLTGTNDLNQPVDRARTTDSDGAYIFSDLRPGTYCIEEIQPSSYADGLESLGTCGGMIAQNDKVCDIVVAENGRCVNYNFGERPLPGVAVQPGQTATIGFWQNRNGQALIRAFDGGGVSTDLGDWLAATLPNLFGANAGADNLAGQSNTQVAGAFRQRFLLKGVKVDAQLMATALSVYATTSSLGGASAGAYGFNVTQYGLANATFSVGSNGAAFGVANNTSHTVLDFLQAADARAINGVLYGGDVTLRRMCNEVFSAINEAGDR